ncbi:MAG: TRAP transporter small permease subunit [Rhodobacteraceae bacterium]|nr:TRAP transporter small permease subunit [Paracoccaceae bacterium]
MMEALVNLLTNLVVAIPNAGYALVNLGDWLNWSDRQALMRFVYYGASFELLYFFIAVILVLTGIGLWRRSVMWRTVRVLEFVGNWVGRFFAWAGLIMVVQQVMIVFLQRIFRVSEISIGPFGYAFTRDLGWYGEELKLYNAMVVCLCCGYTFIQGGHVRVDLFYAGASHRAKKIVDMAGSILFMLPALFLIWLYAWFFMWRHLIVPKPSASDTLERLVMKARAMRWNVETIGFSPSGFDGYFIFKILLVAFSGLLILQAVAFFYRSLLEFREGPQSVNRFADPDRLDQVVSGNAD